MNIVRFKDGTYGVRRRRWFTYEFLWLSDAGGHLWVEKSDSHFSFCKGTEAQAAKYFDLMTDNGVIIWR